MKPRFQWLVDHALLLILGGFVALVLVVQLIGSGITVYRTVIRPSGVAPPGARFVVVQIVLFVGFLLARVRYTQHKVYGLLQLGLAGVAAWSLTAHPVSADPLGNTAALCGVALLAARGFYDESEPDWTRLDEESKRWAADLAESEKKWRTREESYARMSKELEEDKARLEQIIRVFEARK